MCEREGEGEGEGQRVQTDLCERGVIFEFSLFKTRVSETRFYFSKPSLRHTRSTCADPRGVSTWIVPTSGKETEPQRLDFGPGNRASEARVANNIYSF